MPRDAALEATNLGARESFLLALAALVLHSSRHARGRHEEERAVRVHEMGWNPACFKWCFHAESTQAESTQAESTQAEFAQAEFAQPEA